MSDSNAWKLIAQREKAAKIASVITEKCPMSASDAAQLNESGRRAAAMLSGKKGVSDACWQMVVDRLRENEERDARVNRNVVNRSAMCD